MEKKKTPSADYSGSANGKPKKSAVKTKASRTKIGDLDFTDAETSLIQSSGRQHFSWSPIKVQVSNGDLMYARYPVVAGHFLNDGLFSVEKAIDWHLKGELSRRLQLGLYPGEICTYELILLHQKEYVFPGSIILGLGRQGVLTAFTLSQSVEQAIAKYLTLFNAFSQSNDIVTSRNGEVGISGPAIGSGYGGLSIEASLRAIIQGVQNANEKVKKVYGPDARIVQLIEFTELFEDKALDYVYTLDRMQKDQHAKLHFTFDDKKITEKAGARKRLPFDDTSDWWTRIEVCLDESSQDNSDTIRGLKYTISTDAARQEERTVLINFTTIHSMLEDLSTQNKWTEALAKTIFEMLIPNDFKDQLRKQNNLIFIVNKETAVFPWELLQDKMGDTKPLSVNAGMVRQLATPDFRSKITPVLSQTALVIADPDGKDTYPQLDSAFREGEMVADIIKSHNFETFKLLRKGSGDILVSLLSKDYKVIHFAGHGVFNADLSKPTGMMIGPDAYLTPAIINQMSNVPELVFVNCCFLGAGNADAEAMMQSRHKLAANIGTQLIDIGVKAVVVAGWAIEDDSALLFAEEFYTKLFAGETFGNAVRKSRERVYENDHLSGNTWGAFQCYGDPFYTLDGQSRSNRNHREEFVVEREAEIDLYNLLSKQNTGQYTTEFVESELNRILEKLKRSSLKSPMITEWVAKLYYSLSKYPEAIEWYTALLRENNSQFTLGALEKLCNIRAKQCVKEWKENGRKKIYCENLLTVIKDLDHLLQFSETVNRLAIMGSTYKRLALIQEADDKLDAYIAAAAKYHRANELNTPGKKHYTLTNWLLIDRLVDGIANDISLTAKRKYTVPDFSQSIKYLDEELSLFRANAAEETRFLNLIAEPGILLTKFILGDESIAFEELSECNRRIWLETGSPGEKESLLDHFEFLIDLLGFVTIHKKQEAEKLNKIIAVVQQLHRESESIVPARFVVKL
jgi:CHAT domain-containing protein